MKGNNEFDYQNNECPASKISATWYLDRHPVKSCKKNKYLTVTNGMLSTLTPRQGLPSAPRAGTVSDDVPESAAKSVM
jgi:hypothetical protein